MRSWCIISVVVVVLGASQSIVRTSLSSSRAVHVISTARPDALKQVDKTSAMSILRDITRPRGVGVVQGSRSFTTAKPPQVNTTKRPSLTKVVRLWSWKWNELSEFITFTFIVLLTGYLRNLFRRIYWLACRIPEPCVMIAVGAILGAILQFNGIKIKEDADAITGDVQQGTGKPVPEEVFFPLPAFSSILYFMVLVPPIVLDAAYTLYDKEFAETFVPVFLFGVVGKLINAALIGVLLYLIARYGWMASMKDYGDPITTNYHLTLVDSFLFGAIITGVDSTCLLPILESAGVTKELYFLLLGESLLNDAVTTSMYSSVLSLDSEKVDGLQYTLVVLAFLVTAMGGLAIGVVAGLVTSLLTRATDQFRVLEPLLLMGVAYFAYVSAELVGMSGQVCLIGCGIVQAHYAFKNISPVSLSTTKYITKMLSNTCDAIVFLYLGLDAVKEIKDVHYGFLGWTLGLCFVSRFMGQLSVFNVVSGTIGYLQKCSGRFHRKRERAERSIKTSAGSGS